MRRLLALVALALVECVGYAQTGCSPGVNGCGQLAVQGNVPIASLWGFGDSYIYGQGATSPTVTGIFGTLSADTPAPASNFAASGANTPTIVNKIFANFVGAANIPSVTISDGGANDGLSDTCGGTAGTACVKNFQNALMAGEAWLSIPSGYRLMASTATKTGGWAVDNTLTTTPSTLTLASPGTPEKVSASAATLSFAVPVWTSRKLGLTYLITNAQTGTFTVSIDGTLQTDICSGTTTFSSGPCSGTAVPAETSTFFRQEFSVTSGVSHTVLITTTNATNVSIVSVDGVPPTSNLNTNAVFNVGVGTAFSAVYNAASKVVTNQLQADGLPVFFVDIRNGIPGVNGTTDLSTSATAICPASLSSNHPNDCGYRNMLATVNNTETASSYKFSSYLSGAKFVANQGVLNAPLTVNVPALTSTLTESSNSNFNALTPTTSNFSPMWCSYPISSGNLLCTGLAYDPAAAHAGFTNSIVSSFPVAHLYCPGGTTQPSGCTETAYWDTSGNQTNKGWIQIGSTAAGTCSAALAGQFQYTQGNATTKDIVQVCAHDASNVYAWRTIY